jgi:hypothetical protein
MHGIDGLGRGTRSTSVFLIQETIWVIRKYISFRHISMANQSGRSVTKMLCLENIDLNRFDIGAGIFLCNPASTIDLMESSSAPLS